MNESFERVTGVPRKVLTETKQYIDDYLATHNRFFPPTHEHAGNNSERASVGLPGHCWVCAAIGHIKAHPEYGCGDVQCNDPHREV